MDTEFFGIGDLVNVTSQPGDAFTNFTGRIVNKRGENLTVQDQDGDCWDCVLSQVKHSSDSEMHN